MQIENENNLSRLSWFEKKHLIRGVKQRLLTVSEREWTWKSPKSLNMKLLLWLPGDNWHDIKSITKLSGLFSFWLQTRPQYTEDQVLFYIQSMTFIAFCHTGKPGSGSQKSKWFYLVFLVARHVATTTDHLLVE